MGRISLSISRLEVPNTARLAINGTSSGLLYHLPFDLVDQFRSFWPEDLARRNRPIRAWLIVAKHLGGQLLTGVANGGGLRRFSIHNFQATDETFQGKLFREKVEVGMNVRCFRAIGLKSWTP
jgi:hypothetical protein